MALTLRSGIIFLLYIGAYNLITNYFGKDTLTNTHRILFFIIIPFFALKLAKRYYKPNSKKMLPEYVNLFNLASVDNDTEFINFIESSLIKNKFITQIKDLNLILHTVNKSLIKARS